MPHIKSIKGSANFREGACRVDGNRVNDSHVWYRNGGKDGEFVCNKCGARQKDGSWLCVDCGAPLLTVKHSVIYDAAKLKCWTCHQKKVLCKE